MKRGFVLKQKQKATLTDRVRILGVVLNLACSEGSRGGISLKEYF